MEILSKQCVNSEWIADFLTNKDQECCECFGRCKVKVRCDKGYEYILTESEIKQLQEFEKNGSIPVEAEVDVKDEQMKFNDCYKSFLEEDKAGMGDREVLFIAFTAGENSSPVEAEVSLRPTRFYCNKCGKELFECVDYKQIANDTIEEIMNTCICNDCLYDDAASRKVK